MMSNMLLGLLTSTHAANSGCPVSRPQPKTSSVPSRQNFTRIDRLIRFSIFFKSGVKPGTNAPGDPHIFSTIGAVGQVGVTPPGPEKYGTFAARWLNSQRMVTYWLGM